MANKSNVKKLIALIVAQARIAVEKEPTLPSEPPLHTVSSWRAAVLRLMSGDTSAKQTVDELRKEELRQNGWAK
jgi:hypothetical protein